MSLCQHCRSWTLFKSWSGIDTAFWYHLSVRHSWPQKPKCPCDRAISALCSSMDSALIIINLIYSVFCILLVIYWLVTPYGSPLATGFPGPMGPVMGPMGAPRDDMDMILPEMNMRLHLAVPRTNVEDVDLNINSLGNLLPEENSKSPLLEIRSYFPETWLWLLAVTRLEIGLISYIRARIQFGFSVWLSLELSIFHVYILIYE